MRNMSFFYTKRQFLDGTKDVTRRLGWKFLRRGDLFMGVEKSQGLGKGGKINRLGVCRAVVVNRERLCDITKVEVEREGFPGMSPTEFVEMFCRHMKCSGDAKVTRIEFERLQS